MGSEYRQVQAAHNIHTCTPPYADMDYILCRIGIWIPRDRPSMIGNSYHRSENISVIKPQYLIHANALKTEMGRVLPHLKNRKRLPNLHAKQISIP